MLNANSAQGQAVIFRKGAGPVAYQIEEKKAYSPDIFEFCYFARPDSIIDGISVNESRENMGHRLAEKIKRVLTPEEIQEIDVIIPIPETSNVSAHCVAATLKRKHVAGFIKNRYVSCYLATSDIICRSTLISVIIFLLGISYIHNGESRSESILRSTALLTLDFLAARTTSAPEGSQEEAQCDG